jgi:hypothetical protein
MQDKPTRTWVIQENIRSEVELPATITDAAAAEAFICNNDIGYLERSEVLDRNVWAKDPIKLPYNVGILPKHMQEGVVGYLEHGWKLGSFLSAIFTNDLVKAYGRADGINRAAMETWAQWLYNYCPQGAWGSPQKVEAWQNQQREETRNRT